MTDRPFRWLLTASGLSNTADGIVVVAMPLLAITLTRSPLLVSLVSAAATLPWLLLSLHAGALADRHDRRRILALTTWTRVTVLTALAAAAWLGTLPLPALLAGALLLGAGEVFADTSAQSVVPMTVARERLGDANGKLVAAQTIGNNFLGGPAAGLLTGLGAAAAFGAPALLYAAAGIALLGMRGRFRVEEPSTRPLHHDIAEGLRHLWSHRVLRDLALLSGVLNFANSAYFAVFVLWVVGEESRVGLTPGRYGLLMVALAFGAVAGSLLTDRVARKAGQVRTLVVVDLAGGVLLLVPALVPTPAAIGLTAVLLGAAGATANVLRVSLRQRLIPGHLLGRVNSAIRLIGMGSTPLGAAAGGALATAAGLPAVFAAASVLCVLAVTLTCRSVTTRSVAEAESAADTTVQPAPA
ncbi:major facilitator transporter [Planomonospora sphaerica]|uniref:Major facilitator transporter n=1 Tax=Planomonospora sphaerica TaxID=161355 RepID=A0A171DPC3_9ACTN|nr:MFS transporter [Planomonospora sphaerica]GAT70905.1 major facilitator transporter [Planomonospora sphaerica]